MPSKTNAGNAGNCPSPTTFRLSPGSVKTIGRSTGAELILDAALVSRLHCRVEAHDETLEVVETDSERVNALIALGVALAAQLLYLAFRFRWTFGLAAVLAIVVAAVLLFVILWFTFSYLPMAHMVWYWDGPDAITDAASLEKVTAAAGWLWAKGALDFAGGTVVHINAGIAGLVGALLIGKRTGYGKDLMAPHSLTMTMTMSFCSFRRSRQKSAVRNSSMKVTSL